MWGAVWGRVWGSPLVWGSVWGMELTKTIDVYTTADGRAWLAKEAARTNTSPSDIVRRALVAFPGAEPKARTETPRTERLRVRVTADQHARLTAGKVSDLVAGALRDYQFSEARTADGGVRFRERAADRT